MKKHIVHVIYSMKHGGAESLLLEAVKGETGVAEVTRYPATVVCWNHEGSLGSEMRATGVPMFVLNRQLRPMWNLPLFLIDFFGLVRDISSIARKADAGIIHGHLIDSALIAAFVARRTGAHSVATIYSNHVVPMSIAVSSLKHQIWVRVAKWCLGRVDRTVSISADVTETLVRSYGAPRDRVRLVPVSVSPRQFVPEREEARAKFGLSPETLCMVSVGRLVDNKNQAELIAMTAQLHQNGLSVQLLLVGDGPDRAFLTKQIEDTGVGEQVCLLGLYPNVEVVLAAADMFVTASKSEGVSLALLEAMSAGVAIVSTNNAGNSELLKNGVGTLVNSTTRGELARAVVDLWTDDAARIRQLQRARRHFEANFSPAASRAAAAKVYCELLGSGVES